MAEEFPNVADAGQGQRGVTAPEGLTLPDTGAGAGQGQRGIPVPSQEPIGPGTAASNQTLGGALGTNMGGPVFNANPQSAKLYDQALQMGKEGAVAKESAENLKAQSEAKQASELSQLTQQDKDEAHKLYKEKQAQMKEASPFAPSQENSTSMMALFGIMNVMAGMSGGSGKYSAMNAMANMTGALKGYQEGKKDLFEREIKEYEKNFNALKYNNELQEKLYNEAMTLLSKDKEAGMAKIKELAALDNTGIVAQLARSGRLTEIGKIIDARAKGMQQAEQHRETIQNQWSMQRERERHALELAQQKAELGGSKGAQQLFRAQNTVNALGGLASVAENISKLPAKTNIGSLQNLQTRDGMFNFVRNATGRELTSKDAKALETLYTGVTRNLAAIETSGAATGLVGLATQLEKIIPKKGDGEFNVALKIADLRRIAEENLKPLLDAGLLPKQQSETAKALLVRLEKAIPFTTQDVLDAQYSGGAESIGEMGKRVSQKEPSITWSDADEKRLQELESKHGGK